MQPLDFTAEQTKALLASGQLVHGFSDTHLHLVEYGKFLRQTDLREMTSIAELIEVLKHTDGSSAIEAFGWNQDAFIEKRMPTRYDLDQIATDRPVLLSRICGHVTAVNSFVVQALGLDQDIPQIAGGMIDCDDEGIPTGILRERARSLLTRAGYYDGTIETVRECILLAQADLIAKGICCVHSDDLTSFPNLSGVEIMSVFEDLVLSDQLKLKVIEQAQGIPEEIASHMGRLRSQRFEIGSLKLFTDGSLGARTAQLLEPYSDAPDQLGIGIQEDAVLFDLMARAYKVGLPLSIHAIGDGAISRVLKGFEQLEASKEYLEKCGIVHCQITNPTILSRMADLGIRAYIQPIFIHEDAKMVYQRVGTKRAESSYVWHTMRTMGIPLYMSSDAPIDTPDVIKGLYCAVKRSTLDDEPIVYLPEQGLALADALSDYQRTDDPEDAWVLLDQPLEACLENPWENHIVATWLHDRWHQVKK